MCVCVCVCACVCVCVCLGKGVWVYDCMCAYIYTKLTRPQLHLLVVGCVVGGGGRDGPVDSAVHRHKTEATADGWLSVVVD